MKNPTIEQLQKAGLIHGINGYGEPCYFRGRDEISLTDGDVIFAQMESLDAHSSDNSKA